MVLLIQAWDTVSVEQFSSCNTFAFLLAHRNSKGNTTRLIRVEMMMYGALDWFKPAFCIDNTFRYINKFINVSKVDYLDIQRQQLQGEECE